MGRSLGLKKLLPLIYIFVGLLLVFLFLQSLLGNLPVNFTVLQVANILLFLVCIISAELGIRAIGHKNVQVFLRNVYGSFLIKFFILVAAAMIYIFIYKAKLNKPALFGSIGMYFLYTFAEVRLVLKNRNQSNA